MNKNKAILNITISTVFKIILLIINLIVRKTLISSLGNEVIGVFSLLTSIIGFLSIAELGIGTAISFSMYKPIVDNDQDKISGLYRLYKKIYVDRLY